jgi:uncharacterized membrane-anchored protein YhcB (DUF1043 family)
LLETIAWISIIIGFVVVIAFSMAAMFLMRRREQNTPKSVDYDEAVKTVDAAADAALNELNKTAELVLKDIEEKYQTLLFLYELTEEKLQAASSDRPDRQVPAAGGAAGSRAYNNGTGRYADGAADGRAYDGGSTRYTDGAGRHEAYQAGRGKPERGKPERGKPERVVKKPVAVNAKQAQVLKLYNEGMSAAEIAKSLDIGQGEVRLVIDLAERGTV